MIQYYILLSLVIGFVIVSYFIPKIILISREKKLFDVPNERSASRVITPNLGGIAIFAGFYVSLNVALHSFNTQSITPLLLASVVMFLIGLKDDLIGLSARKKLFFQVLTAMYLIFLGGVRISSLHGIMGIYEIDPYTSSVISLVAIVGIVNAYNLIDGIDGLAAGIGILISVAFGALFTLSGQTVYAIAAFSLTGSLVAFFFFNVFSRVNKIFMGDTGSLTLGIIFAFLTIKFLDHPSSAHQQLFGSPGVALSIMIVPLVDTIRVMAIRIWQKRSPFSPDMNHIHHHLIRLTNNNHLHASMILIFWNMAYIAFACSFVYLFNINLLFFFILGAGFFMAAIPVWVNKRNEKAAMNKASVEIKVIQLNSENLKQRVQSGEGR